MTGKPENNARTYLLQMGPVMLQMSCAVVEGCGAAVTGSITPLGIPAALVEKLRQAALLRVTESGLSYMDSCAQLGIPLDQEQWARQTAEAARTILTCCDG